MTTIFWGPQTAQHHETYGVLPHSFNTRYWFLGWPWMGSD